MQIAATLGMVGSDGSGRMPLAHRARTLPSVSFPSRVVRSIIRMARSSAHSLDSRLIDRRCRLATRSSMPTWSTPPDPLEHRLQRISAPDPGAHERIRLSLRRPTACSLALKDGAHRRHGTAALLPLGYRHVCISLT